MKKGLLALVLFAFTLTTPCCKKDKDPYPDALVIGTYYVTVKSQTISAGPGGQPQYNVTSYGQTYITIKEESPGVLLLTDTLTHRRFSCGIDTSMTFVPNQIFYGGVYGNYLSFAMPEIHALNGTQMMVGQTGYFWDGSKVQ